MLVIATIELFYITLLRSPNEIGHPPIPKRPGLDGAKGVQGEQLHRIEPPAGRRTSSPASPTTPRCFRAPPRTSSVSHWLARSPPRDFLDVTLADEESASEFPDVTLAREDDRRGVHRHYQTQTKVASLLFV